MATLREVAKKANVSLATASRVANGLDCVQEETRHKVLSVMHDLNYAYVYHKSSKKNITIAMLIPKQTVQEIFHHPSLQTITMGVVHQCDESKVRNTIIPLDMVNFRKNSFCFNGADAYIFLGTTKKEEDTLIPLLQERGIPFVLVNRWIDMRNISYVNVNDYSAVFNATIAMINNGHRKLGMVNGPIDMRNSTERLKGFTEACQSRDIPIRPEWIFHGPNNENNGRTAASELLTLKERPTCMMSSYDVMAKGLIQGLLEGGLGVPEDVSVVGWGDVDYAAYITPSLTTVRMPSFELGAEAAKAALQLLQSPLLNQIKITMNCQLIERNSTRSIEPEER